MVFLILLGLLDIAVGIHLLSPFIPSNWIFIIGLYFLYRSIMVIIKTLVTGFSAIRFFGIIDILLCISLIFSITVPFLWITAITWGIVGLLIGTAKITK